jgi:GAF domain-containing protein
VGGDSMIGRCVLSGQADIQLDVGEAAVRFDNPYLPDTRSELALPLRSGTEVLGAMTVQSDQAAFFSEEDISVLQTVADQVANAVRNARLFQQVESSLEAERRAYGELSAQAWHELAREQGGVGFVKQGGVVSPLARGLGDRSGEAARTGQVVIGTDNAVALPIRIGERVVAVLDAQLPQDMDAWPPEQLALLEALSEQIAQTMERARLYRDTQRRAAREQLISQVTGRVRESLDIEQVLQTATEEFYQALELQDLTISLTVAEPESNPDR